jgi:hypothetical protein
MGEREADHAMEPESIFSLLTAAMQKSEGESRHDLTVREKMRLGDSRTLVKGLAGEGR